MIREYALNYSVECGTEFGLIEAIPVDKLLEKLDTLEKE